LFTLLTKAAINAGASIRSNARVTSIDLKGLMPAATLESGERVQGDIIIGAGGFSSLARKVVLEGAPAGTPDPRIAYKSVSRSSVEHGSDSALTGNPVVLQLHNPT
jgi:salicylate hydroxylase